MNKKGQIGIDFIMTHIGKILLVLLVLAALLFVILYWAVPALSNTLKSFDFW